MSDLISRQAAKNVLANLGIDIEDYWEDAIDELPSVEPEKCEDCISRQAVNKLLDELARAISDEKCHIQRGRNYGRIMHDILELPSVESERKTGKWIVYEDCEGKTRTCTCNLCGYETGEYTWENPNYCENCGAKMEVKDDT